MPAVPEWDVLLRGGVLRALGQRGCRSGWTVSNFRGRARLHITARAGDGHRKQLLLPDPWESDQLEAIRDGVMTCHWFRHHADMNCIPVLPGLGAGGGLNGSRCIARRLWGGVPRQGSDGGP
jgi:hypothetical protein